MIEIEELTYRYKGIAEPTLHRVDLAIAAGQCFGLIGPNGAGKTTLIALMTGASEIQGGDIRIADHSLRTERSKVKHLGSVVPQDLAFYPSLTGRANMQFFAGAFSLDQQRRDSAITRCAEICQLADILDRHAESYSGGLKRRLNLAIGLLNDPQVLYLDEPTVGIDTNSRHAIIEAIQHLKTTGMTIIYTSHYMEEVEAICDELAVIRNGTIIARDTMQGFLHLAQQKSLRVTVANGAGPEARPAFKHKTVRWLDDRTLVVALEDDADLSTVISEIQSADLVIDQIEYGVSRLEDVYLGLLDRP